jgi:hypothetical protein
VRSEPSPMPEAVCSLCLTAPRNIRVGPCGHASLCSSCYPKFMQANTLCPICREPITSHTMSDDIVREPTYLSDFSGATSIQYTARRAAVGSFLPLAHGTELSNSRHDNRQPAHHHPDSDLVSRDCFIRNFKYVG